MRFLGAPPHGNPNEEPGYMAGKGADVHYKAAGDQVFFSLLISRSPS